MPSGGFKMPSARQFLAALKPPWAGCFTRPKESGSSDASCCSLWWLKIAPKQPVANWFDGSTQRTGLTSSCQASMVAMELWNWPGASPWPSARARAEELGPLEQ